MISCPYFSLIFLVFFITWFFCMIIIFMLIHVVMLGETGKMEHVRGGPKKLHKFNSLY